jgi:hypothetical protein
VKHYILSILIISAGLLSASCTDDLNQMPTTETTSGQVYADANNYKRVLAKIYASYVLAGQGQGGDNGDLSTINGQDYSRGISICKKQQPTRWLSHGCGNNLVV